MARRKIETPLCDRCGEKIEYDHSLGDLNAGVVQLVFPAFTYDMEICPRCMRELRAFSGHHPPTNYKGTATGTDKLYYLPRKDVPPTSNSQGHDGATVRPQQPDFRG